MLIEKLKRSAWVYLFVALFLVLGACSNTEDVERTEKMEGMDHSNMDMSSSGEVPEGLKAAKNPTYPVGSKAIIQEAHMEGMKDAEATIVGAYDTTVYTITYTPTMGGEKVENHKWVVHEELIDVGDAPLEPGAEVKTDASHMKDMEGATVEINSAEQTIVYMVDFTMTTNGEEVKNHKWVTERELSPVK
ncbi:YdhK family protein [Hazenella sp. IB182357]|uniref:YdhK family protein n=1 Tax=Polycladospora coralii TaxID=2771432 RepID=A0A926N755_9BACL|nr:YdhK family protein [Polycladospora coralii]MBD1373106.1 YdhK family protein [Polycladospora coralii]